MTCDSVKLTKKTTGRTSYKYLLPKAARAANLLTTSIFHKSKLLSEQPACAGDLLTTSKTLINTPLLLTAKAVIFFAMKITIMGDPHPMARPRVVKGHVYYLSRDVEWREVIQWTCVKALQLQNRKQYECALKVKVKFYRKLNPTTRAYGDIDNLLKGLFDGMTGIVFADDSQIVSVIAEKYRDKENPRCEVELRAIKIAG